MQNNDNKETYKLYNPELKERFLESYSESTRHFYRYILSKPRTTEEKLKKDVCNFDSAQLDSLMGKYSNRSISAVASVISVLRLYIDFCIEQGYVESRINWLCNIEVKDMDKYIDKLASEKQYISKEELLDIIANCINAQDALCFALPFSGIKPEEMVNLKVSDVDFETNELILRKNNGDTRVVKVEDYVMKLIKDGINQTEYYTSNGLSKSTSFSDSNRILLTDYVMRASFRKSNMQDKLKIINITARISRMKKFTGNNFINPTNLWVSGIIDLAKKIKAEKGELTKSDYIEINKRFGYDEIYWNKIKQKIANYI